MPSWGLQCKNVIKPEAHVDNDINVLLLTGMERVDVVSPNRHNFPTNRHTGICRYNSIDISLEIGWGASQTIV